MGRKPKAGGVKARSKTTERQTTDPEQFARFVEAAREAGVDESGEALERVFAKVAASRKDGNGPKPAVPTVPKKRGS